MKEQLHTERRPWLEFQPQFNAGHILQAAVVVFSMAAAFITLQGRQEQLEKDLHRIEGLQRAQEIRTTDTLRELKGDFLRAFSDVKDALKQIDSKLDRKADK